MKPLHITTVFALAAVLIVFGIHSNRSSAQQPAPSDNDDWGNSKFLQLIGQLIKNNQTNLAVQVGGAIGELDDIHTRDEIDTCLKALQSLHKGRTDEAINLLESKMYSDLIGYSHISHSRHMDDTVREVRKYRDQFPYKDSNPDIDEDISNSLHSVSP